MEFLPAYSELLKRQLLKTRNSFADVGRTLSALGNPHHKLKFVHIAGTNGKGSVAVMCANALSLSGEKTGLYTSPHLVSICERIKINGTDISERAFADAVGAVLAAETVTLTYFEVLTCAAFLHFARNNCSFAVLETGIGGRLDVTNIIARPEVSIITSVGFDHVDLLGDSIEKIAYEKAGIIKSGGICVCAQVPPEALVVIKRTAAEKDARLIYAPDDSPFDFHDFDWHRNSTLFRDGSGGIHAVSALGEPYVLNAQTVVSALSALGLDRNRVLDSLADFVWPARFQVLRVDNGTGHCVSIVIDGAHNEQAAELFAKTFKMSPYASCGRKTLLLTVMKDKDFQAILKILVPLFDKFVMTASSSARTLNPCHAAEIVKRLRPGADVIVEPDIKAALNIALDSSVCAVAGSFYLAGAVLDILGREFGACVKQTNGEL